MNGYSTVWVKGNGYRYRGARAHNIAMLLLTTYIPITYKTQYLCLLLLTYDLLPRRMVDKCWKYNRLRRLDGKSSALEDFKKLINIHQ